MGVPVWREPTAEAPKPATQITDSTRPARSPIRRRLVRVGNGSRRRTRSSVRSSVETRLHRLQTTFEDTSSAPRFDDEVTLLRAIRDRWCHGNTTRHSWLPGRPEDLVAHSRALTIAARAQATSRLATAQRAAYRNALPEPQNLREQEVFELSLGTRDDAIRRMLNQMTWALLRIANEYDQAHPFTTTPPSESTAETRRLRSEEIRLLQERLVLLRAEAPLDQGIQPPSTEEVMDLVRSSNQALNHAHLPNYDLAEEYQMVVGIYDLAQIVPLAGSTGVSRFPRPYPIIRSDHVPNAYEANLLNPSVEIDTLPPLRRMGRRQISSRLAAELSSRRPRYSPVPTSSSVPADGLGDRDRSISPDNWETLLTTIPPDERAPSADSSFTSATATASASASHLTSTVTSSSTPLTAASPVPAYMEDCELSDVSTDSASDIESETEIATLIRQSRAYMNTRAGLSPIVPNGPPREHSRRHQPWQEHPRPNRSLWDNHQFLRYHVEVDADAPVHELADMQLLIHRLARREDIPDEWWAAAGLARILPHEARVGAATPARTYNDRGGDVTPQW
ncbi:MAG: hypothetical protein M1824_005351 [Vezdaea acicularis]|nr:MAG: hypothetical protein M1824_005351 [Vezdaea acicularis]